MKKKQSLESLKNALFANEKMDSILGGALPVTFQVRGTFSDQGFYDIKLYDDCDRPICIDFPSPQIPV